MKISYSQIKIKYYKFIDFGSNYKFVISVPQSVTKLTAKKIFCKVYLDAHFKIAIS